MSQSSEERPEGSPAWVDLMVTDHNEAQAFYGGLFGWEFAEVSPSDNSYAIASVGGAAVAGLGELPDARQVRSPAWTTYLAVRDADATAAKINEAGGKMGVDPVDVPGGRMAIACDPGGAYFGLWQPGSLQGTALLGEPSSVCWNEVMTRDFAAVRDFYTAVFSYTTQDMSDEYFVYAALELDGTPISGIGELSEDVPPEIPPHWMTYFACADTDATVALATELGALVLNEPADAGFGRIAVLRGPAGEVFSVVTMRGQ